MKEIEAALRKAMQSLRTREQREEMLHQTIEGFIFLNGLWRRPQLVRLAFFRVYFALYDYLRSREQLGRREGDFDKKVRKKFVSVLSKIMKEYGRL